MTIPLSELPEIIAQLPSPMRGNHIAVLIDANGKIVEVRGSRQTMQYASIAEEISGDKNIRDTFDLSPYARLTDIPELADPGKGQGFVTFYNQRHFRRLEDPDRFYTSIPTVQLSLFRLEPERFLGIVRPLDTVPNIALESASCIIYTDTGGRLRGFNHTFYQFFKDRHPDPAGMLNRPVEDFLTPPPGALYQKEISGNPFPGTSAFKTVFEADFRSSRGLQGLKISDEKSVSFSAGGLTCGNDSDDIVFFTLPVIVDSRNDLYFSAEADTVRGAPPVFFLGRKFDPGEPREAYPDTEGYLVGPDPDARQYVLKRKSTIQHAGEAAGPGRGAVYAMAKTGNVLRYLENGIEKLAYCDFNFLHDRKTYITLGVRIGSVVTIRAIRLGVKKRREEGNPLNLPLTRLKIPGETYALLSRISNLTLSMRFPEISVYLLENITEIQRQVNLLRQENQRLLVEMGKADQGFIGKSADILAIKRNAAMVANADATVLIQGETGTGKEQLAGYIHGQGRRKEGPFVKVDCSTLSKTLMESELFGHEKGAFTGAVERKIGSFERAQGGTLFLDEVGNLPLDTQAKLLHFLQDRTITRVGGQEPLQLDVRIIVASNAPLQELVKKGLFRSDLFFRMDVVSITLPPLRQRKEDIPDFCRAFLRASNTVHHKDIKDLSPAAYQKIFGHAWPGNIRELKNTLERAVIFCEAPFIGEDLIQFSMEAGLPARPARVRKPYQFSKISLEEVKTLLAKHRGNMKEAAAELGVPRRTLYHKLRQLGVSVADLRKAL